MPDSVDPHTADLRVTLNPGSEEYKLPLLLDRLKRDPSVADVEWLDRPTVDDQGRGEEVTDGGQ